MSRFIYINGDYINSNQVVRTERRGEYLGVYLKNEKYERIHDKYRVYEEEINGEDFIVQVIPCVKPLYVNYREDADKIVERPIYYLGLCASGYVRPLDIYGYEGVMFADDASNYLGLYDTKDGYEKET